MVSDGGFYCLTCEKLFAPPSPKEEYSFRVTSGPTFDGSFGVDTEDRATSVLRTEFWLIVYSLPYIAPTSD